VSEAVVHLHCEHKAEKGKKKTGSHWDKVKAKTGEGRKFVGTIANSVGTRGRVKTRVRTDRKHADGAQRRYHHEFGAGGRGQRQKWGGVVVLKME